MFAAWPWASPHTPLSGRTVLRDISRRTLPLGRNSAGSGQTLSSRAWKLTLVPIIQSLAQLEKNYGKEGAEIIVDNVQDLRHEVA